MSYNQAVTVMAESLNNLLDFRVTVPLTSKTRNIHTNRFIYLEFPDLPDNIDYIYGKVTNKVAPFRYTLYRPNYWYVKAVEINSEDATMTLTLTAFPTPYNKEKLQQPQKKTTTTNTETETIKMGDVSFLSKKDKQWAIRTVNTATKGKSSDLDRAKAVYSYFKKHYGYTGYSNLRYTTPRGNRESAFNRGSGNCADGAQILETLMLVAGINARIKHAPNHYIVKLKIGGKTYWVDNSRGKGVVTWNTVWRGVTSESEANITDGRYING